MIIPDESDWTKSGGSAISMKATIPDKSDWTNSVRSKLSSVKSNSTTLSDKSNGTKSAGSVNSSSMMNTENSYGVTPVDSKMSTNVKTSASVVLTTSVMKDPMTESNQSDRMKLDESEVSESSNISNCSYCCKQVCLALT